MDGQCITIYPSIVDRGELFTLLDSCLSKLGIDVIVGVSECLQDMGKSVDGTFA